MTWLIHPLPVAPFRPLFGLSDTELKAVGARRMVADAPHAAPCRVSLEDAEPGERLILAHHVHLDVAASPYRQGGPVFVREAAVEAVSTAEVPDMLARRLLSVRAFDAEAMMTDAEALEGRDLAAWLDKAFSNAAVERVQVHTARRGCFLAEARRR
jgi:hypothetical protein